MYKEYVPNPIIVDRAVELWVDLLRKPKYDNGDTTSNGAIAGMLVSMLPANNDEETLSRFAEELRKILLEPLEWESNGKTYTTLFRHLDVDYHPDVPLAEAAKRAGLKMEFPWKTNMWLYEDRLSLSVGYGSENIYHYPLSEGRWLVTSLYGSDITKIIGLIESGVLNLDLTPIENK